MAYRSITVHTQRDYADTLDVIIAEHNVIDTIRTTTRGSKSIVYQLTLRTEDTQTIIDQLQRKLYSDPEHRITIAKVETILRHQKPEIATTGKASAGISREELVQSVARGAEVDRTFLLLVVLSTIVASIGLLENNVAVVIGAMVIAPLLGPNLALALATALGEKALMKKAIHSNIVGFVLCLVISILLGMIWPFPLDSHELLSRTDVGFSGVVLAIAAGSAAILSLTAGMSSVLVGVMVAVALLPPATTLGMMIGAGEWNYAYGAGLLLAVNIVCVNLSAKIVFWLQDLKPRTRYKQLKVKRTRHYYLLFWLLALIALISAIFLR